MFSQRLPRHLVAIAISALPFGMVGCAERPPEVPSTALSTAEGNQLIVYTAEQDGTVWISDQGTNKILYSGRVNRGDHVVIDPSKGRILVNDQVVLNQEVNGNDHKVFFQPGQAMGPRQAPNVPRAPGVPEYALLKGEGNNQVEYTADNDGSVWVTDTDSKDVIYSGRVVRGDRVSIDPTRHVLMVNSQAITNQSLPDHNFQIYFTAESVATPAAATISPWPAAVPVDAVLRNEGTPRSQLIADADGTVWVVDATTNQLLYSGRVLKGDTLTIDAEANALTLNNRPAYTSDLPRHDRYSIFFRPG